MTGAEYDLAKDESDPLAFLPITDTSADDYAYLLPEPVPYYLLKTGNNTTGYRSFIFENIGNLKIRQTSLMRLHRPSLGPYSGTLVEIEAS